jgi:hypothetical protein|nr:MAG TPA: hypothetical protein [Caudoviricetes sp.]
MYKLYVEDILLFSGSLGDCDKYIKKNLCTGYYLIKGDDVMKKQVQKFWRLKDWVDEDQFESLMVLGILTFEDNGTQSTIYFDINNDDLPVNENIVKNGARNLSGSYFYGTKDQYLYFLENEF